MASGQYVNLRVTNKMVLPVNTNIATINGQSLIELRESVNIAIIGLTDGDKGDITVSGSGTLWTIDNDVVTFAKMQNISTDVLLGRDTALSGNTEEISVGGGIVFTGSAGIQTSAFTGDATKALGGTILTLATVNASIGTFGTATEVGTFTVNGKGLITSASNTSILITQSQVSSLTTDLGLKAPLANPTFTGTVTIPTPFTLGAISVTTTGTQLNYLNAATGTTGTASTNIVFSTSPTLVTPTLGVARATSINTGTTLNGVGFFKSTTAVSLSSTAHAATFGDEATGLNMAQGIYSTALGIQGRNNGVATNIFLQPLGAGVSVGDGSLTGQRIFAVNNTGAGTGDYASIEVRNGSAGTDALRLWCMGTGFTPSGSNLQDSAIVTAGTGLSGGMSLGTLASADLRLYTNNTLRWTMAGATGNITTTGQFLSSGGGIGYTTGAGGTVTQLVSRTTTVVNNKLCGTITMFSAAQAADALVTFTLTNSFISATDFVLVQHISATNGGAWDFSVVAGAGSATINIRNTSGASITEATPLRFFVLKAVNS
jgi:hypothetical protein